jgi:hypothetical protein
VRVVSEVNLAAVVGEVGQDDTKIHETGKDTGAETSDGRGGLATPVSLHRDRMRRDTHNLSEIHRAHHNSLSDTQSGNEATGVDGGKASVCAQEDANPKNPQKTQLTSSPDTANAVTDQERTVWVRKLSYPK